MTGLLAAFALGAVAGGAGAMAAARLVRTDLVQARLDEAQSQMSSMSGLLAETRTVLDQTRGQLQGVWASASGRAPQEADAPEGDTSSGAENDPPAPVRATATSVATA